MVFVKFIITTTSNPYQPIEKREYFQVTRMTSGPSKKISVASHDMKFVFASLLMIISTSQSKRDGRTTLRWDSMDGNVSRWCFFKFIITTTSNPYQPTQKREFSQVTRVTSGPSKKFSVASHDMKFVFASFLTIISISQSKRGGRTTRTSDSMVGNASKWWFLKFHAHWA